MFDMYLAIAIITALNPSAKYKLTTTLVVVKI